MARLRPPWILLLFCLSASISLVTAEDDANLKYGLVIDAGSSGSRIAIYRWVPRASGGFGEVEEFIPEKTIRGEKEVEPGISSYASDPGKAGPSLQPLLDYAASFVPKGLQKSTPLFLGATAGMRLLTVEDQKRVMLEIRKYLSSPDCPFDFRGTNARIISGEEEGVFGWIQLNFLLGIIGARGDLAKEKAKTVTAFDLGGASVQITFEPDHDIMAGVFPVVFDGVVHRLYTHSYLQFGTDRALARVHDAVLTEANSTNESGVIRHPCMLQDLADKVGDQDVTGSGDAEACRALTRQLLLLELPCMNKPCGVMGVHQPHVDLSSLSYGMSNFYYYAKGLGLTDSAGQWTGSIADLSAETSKFCSLKWEDAIKSFPNEKPKYMKSTCFKGIYIEELLLHGFHFPRDEKKLVFSGKIGQEATGWTLGLLLYELQLVPIAVPETVCPQSALSRSSWQSQTLWLGFPALCLLVGFTGGLWYSQRQKLLRNGNGKKDPDVEFGRKRLLGEGEGRLPSSFGKSDFV
mmetsp:Transcript_32404/g.52434  ORF Transcript_32404/g.52434 Transcript_32404/m.52434 type:complete len:520 (+) Transcript_32404:82-1641(+)|eukprot:CAMPEP_0184648360 /NCGR_PEP_ID=MMETSP0308-20130426/5469_1 /TAXON_ID=38269 /ORGANISM="Gloeochaete witrockiana, Strain SAG 46.84" /LENGTH=519 /DNA_ID=CAMNT_0027080129 /DNA_START=24 /DNA_END=1583 /DNA_ORIENTATION=+